MTAVRFHDPLWIVLLLPVIGFGFLSAFSMVLVKKRILKFH